MTLRWRRALGVAAALLLTVSAQGSAHAQGFTAPQAVFPVPNGLDNDMFRANGWYVEGYTILDIDGDRRFDLVFTGPAGNPTPVRPFGTAGNYYWKVHRNTGTAFAAAVNWPVPNGLNAATYGDNGWSEEGFSVFDINGDGKPDIVFTGPAGNPVPATPFGSVGNYSWRVHLNTGSAFAAPTNWPVPNGLNDTIAANNGTLNEGFTIIDINGDGRPDIVFTSPAGNPVPTVPYGTPGNYSWKVHLNTGSGFSAAPTSWSVPNGLNNTIYGDNGWYVEGFSTLDINGDGRPDIVFTGPAGNPTPIRPFGTPGSYYWKVHLNTGSGFPATPTNWPVPNSLSDTISAANGTMVEGSSAIDINGDAKPDIVFTAAAGNPVPTVPYGTPGNYYWKVHFNTGAGFEPAPLNWRVPNGVGASMYRFDDWNYECYSTSDLNGDGRVDLIFTAPASNGGNPYGTAGGYNWRVYVNRGPGTPQNLAVAP